MRRKNITIKDSIREYFFLNPATKLRIRHIEKTMNLSLPSVIRYCKELKEEGILTTVKIGNVVFYTANRGGDKFLLEKKLFNIKQIYLSGIIGYLRRELGNPAVVLFGSYSRGEDTAESDIDLYVQTLSKKSINLRQYEKTLKRRIQIFRYKNIREVPNTHLANNIVNGIVVNGFIEVFG